MNHPPKRWWDPGSAFILLVILITVTSRLVATEWTQNLRSIQFLTILAAILGVFLGLGRFSPTAVISLAFSYGVFCIPWLLGLALGQGDEWLPRLTDLAQRLKISISLFIDKTPVNDPILFLVLMAVLFWPLGIFTGYQLIRNGAQWRIILPTGVVLLVINHYDYFADNGLGYFAVFIFFSLLLLGRSTFLHKKTGWQKEGVSYSPDTGGELTRATIILVLGLILFAWIAPVISDKSQGISDFWATNIMQPWEKFSSRVGDAFTSLQARSIVVQDMFGDSLTLSRGSHHKNYVLFTVTPADSLPEGGRYYWGVRSYDTYLNGQWTTADIQTHYFTSITYDIHYPDLEDRKVVELTFSTRSNLQGIPSGSMPLWISHSVQAILATAPDGTQEVFGLIADPPIRAGEVYQVRSSISAPTITDLQAASQTYPEEITGRYLEIPTLLESEFQQLALQITDGLTTPYEKANAITLWLRGNMSYQEVIETIPTAKDPIEWFLFDSRVGFCNYYATAEVLLLRSIGIPARISAGFAQGTYDSNSNTYFVHESDAHAWPEVYFPGIGWVEFEPTVSQPERYLPSGEAANLTTRPTPTPLNPDKVTPTVNPLNQENNPAQISLAADERNQSLLRIFLILVGLGVVIGLGMVLFLHSHPEMRNKPLPILVEDTLRKNDLPVPALLQRWNRWILLTPFERTFKSLEQALHLMGKPVLVTQTPAERIKILVDVLPEVEYPAHTLLLEYQKAEYSPYQANLPEAKIAAKTIRQAAFKASIRQLFHFLKKKKP
jgi:transglutaminase-like putative cysteine protease